MRRGRFITFEGGEGAGKSTQSRLLTDHLRDLGQTVVTTREPGGTHGAEAIRALLLDPTGEGLALRAEALLFAAARSDHVERLIRPALARGDWVICDRFVDSSRAYQGIAGGLGDEAIQGLHRFGSEGLLPDLTIVLTLDAASIATRLHLRDGDQSDRIGGRDAAYHASVNAAFVSMATQDPDRLALIDASGAPQEVASQVLLIVDQRLGLPC